MQLDEIRDAGKAAKKTYSHTATETQGPRNEEVRHVHKFSMKETRPLMGMPITVEINDPTVTEEMLEKVFAYFTYVDETFSTYKVGSEISRINRGLIPEEEYSDDMREIFALARATKEETNGYFDIRKPGGSCDPSGIVKGWAIKRAADLIASDGYENFYVEAGGDIQSSGVNGEGKPWQVGIRNPFKLDEIIKVLSVSGVGVATSGTYLRGRHIYDPHTGEPAGDEIVSLTVVGKNVYEADRFATAAFAMGRGGIQFIDQLPGFEGYLVDAKGIGTMTRGFHRFVSPADRSYADGELLRCGAPASQSPYENTSSSPLSPRLKFHPPA